MGAEKIIKVLSIEDNRADAFLVEEMLRSSYGESMRLRWEGHLSDAIKRLTESDFDIVLLDLGLGESHGLETYRLVATAAGKMPILVVSGLDDQDVANQSVALGAKAYLVKGSFTEERLNEIVNRIIEESTNGEQNRVEPVIDGNKYSRILSLLKLDTLSPINTVEFETRYAQLFREYLDFPSTGNRIESSAFLLHFENMIGSFHYQRISIHDLVLLHERIVENNQDNRYKAQPKATEFLLLVSLKLLDHCKSE